MKLLHLIPAIALLFTGCGDAETIKEETAAGNIIPEDSHEHGADNTISLNNGEKWLVDTNMIVHIRNMEKEIAGFTPAELKSYTELGGKLQAYIDLLTSNCTMKGQAHDELHKWLLPYMELAEKMESVKDKNEAEACLKEMEDSFNTFNKYFH